MKHVPLLSIALVLTVIGEARSQDMPYAAGRSDFEMEGLKVAIYRPQKMSKKTPSSLVVLLHGMGGSGKNIIQAMSAWAADDYVVCAPSARGRGWKREDLKSVVEIIKKLQTQLPLDKAKLHVIGFSNGGLKLNFLSFHDELRPASATYVGSGHRGGPPAKWAIKHTGIMALAGEKDPYAKEALATVTKLHGRVRHVEARLEPNTGHQWPRSLMPYLQWWMGAQEGRYTAGTDLNFDWKSDFKSAVDSQEKKKRGGLLVYVFDPKEKDKSTGRRLQNELLMDDDVRFLGNQIPALRWSRTEFKLPERTKLRKYPAILVYDRKGKLKKVLQGKIKQSQLIKALKAVAPNSKLPK